mgnify:FL=1
MKTIQVIANIAFTAQADICIEVTEEEYNSPDFDALDHVTLREIADEMDVVDGLEVLDTNRVED